MHPAIFPPVAYFTSQNFDSPDSKTNWIYTPETMLSTDGRHTDKVNLALLGRCIKHMSQSSMKNPPKQPWTSGAGVSTCRHNEYIQS